MDKKTGIEKMNWNYSRREFIKVAAITVGAASACSVCGTTPVPAAEPYDRC